MDFQVVLVGILGLALLMIVHEAGHHVAARAFGMRVIKFSIGFGPAIWRHQPKGSSTIYQVALIPFMAYVQIAGMNPFEENDPLDKESYGNASLMGRITTIFAGPFANYLFATVLYFAGFMIDGQPVPTLEVEVTAGSPAARANMQTGDKVLRVGNHPVKTWQELPEQIRPHPGKPLEIEVERRGTRHSLVVVPERTRDGHGQIGIAQTRMPMPLMTALKGSVVYPAQVATYTLLDLGRIVTGKKKLTMRDLAGPVAIVGETGRAAKRGVGNFFTLLGTLSTFLGIFNLLPFPALDGGRLVFLAYEGIARRKPNAKIEAQIHAVGLAMLLLLIAVVTVFDIRGH
jgi:regulator of sigma E protease